MIPAVSSVASLSLRRSTMTQIAQKLQSKASSCKRLHFIVLYLPLDCTM